MRWQILIRWDSGPLDRVWQTEIHVFARVWLARYFQRLHRLGDPLEVRVPANADDLRCLPRLRDSCHQKCSPMPTNVNQQLTRHWRRQSYLYSVRRNQDRGVEELDATRRRYFGFILRLKPATQPADCRLKTEKCPRNGTGKASDCATDRTDPRTT